MSNEMVVNLKLLLLSVRKGLIVYSSVNLSVAWESFGVLWVVALYLRVVDKSSNLITVGMASTALQVVEVVLQDGREQKSESPSE